MSGLNPESEKYKENLENSIITLGNNYRTKKVIEKLENGQQVYVAAIGGSVTEGAGPKNPDGTEKWAAGYAFKFKEKIEQKYPKAKIIFDGTGLSGSPSALGVIRYEKDVVQELGNTPDIFIIEYSVNDGNECTTTRGFEKLIRNVLEAKDDSLVIPLYAHATYENTQALMIPVAEHYKLPQVSIRNALEKSDCQVDLSKNGEFFDDYVHPTEAGHNYMADCLMKVLEKSKEAPADNKFPVPENYKNKNAFEHFVAIYSSTKDEKVKISAGDFEGTDPYTQTIKKGGSEFPENWYHTSKAGNAPFRMTLTCKALVFVYKHQGHWLDEKYGKADIYMDGEFLKSVDGFSETGWNDCVTEMLLDNDSSAEHTIEIKMAQDSLEKGFTILAFGYSY